MCLLESLWIIIRQRVCNYPTGNGDINATQSFLTRLQGYFYIISGQNCASVKNKKDVKPISPHEEGILSISQELPHGRHPIGLNIERSKVFRNATPNGDATVVQFPNTEAVSTLPIIDTPLINKPGYESSSTMGLDLCKIHESCGPAADKKRANSIDQNYSGIMYMDSGDDYYETSSNSDNSDIECFFNIQDLPVEILHHIFSYLTLPQLCRQVAPVCQRWRHLAADPIHWQRLVIGPNVTSTDLCKCIRRSPLLKSLCLHWRTDLTIAEVNLFSISCRHLQQLNLAYCDNINNTVLDIISDHCKRITCINLEGCRMVDTSSIHYIIKLTKLREVCLSHCAYIETEGIEMLSENLTELQKVNIDGIPNITDSAIKNLVCFHGHHLRMLCVDGAMLSDAAFGAISQCRLLVTLCISFGEILTDYTLEYIRHLTSLRTLRLCKCGGFSLDGLVNLFSLKTFSSLVHLDLSDCINLHDGGIHAIVQCCGRSLRQLYLCWCWYITDTGLQDIIVNCLNMEVLDLMGLCDIGGNCLVLIPTTMPKLHLLDLSQCHQVTDELLVDVVRKLPNLVVFNYYGEKIQYCPQTGRRKHRLHRCTIGKLTE